MDVPGAGPEIARDWGIRIPAALNSRHARETPLRAEVIYDADRPHLEVIPVGAPGDVSALLRPFNCGSSNCDPSRRDASGCRDRQPGCTPGCMVAWGKGRVMAAPAELGRDEFEGERQDGDDREPRLAAKRAQRDPDLVHGGFSEG